MIVLGIGLPSRIKAKKAFTTKKGEKMPNKRPRLRSPAKRIKVGCYYFMRKHQKNNTPTPIDPADLSALPLIKIFCKTVGFQKFPMSHGFTKKIGYSYYSLADFYRCTLGEKCFFLSRNLDDSTLASSDLYLAKKEEVEAAKQKRFEEEVKKATKAIKEAFDKF